MAAPPGQFIELQAINALKETISGEAIDVLAWFLQGVVIFCGSSVNLSVFIILPFVVSPQICTSRRFLL